MVGDRVAEVLIDKGGEFFHGFTYSGHPAACAVAIANLEIFRRERIVERVRHEAAPYLAKRWRELAAHPLVGEARCVGLLAAIELVPDKSSQAVFRAARRGWHPDARYLHAQWSRHARDARYAVHRAASGHFARRNRRTTVQSSAVSG